MQLHDIKMFTDYLCTDKVCVASLKEKSESRRIKAGRHAEKKRRICKYIDQIQCTTTKYSKELCGYQENIHTFRQQHIRDLLHYIFSLEEVEPKR